MNNYPEDKKTIFSYKILVLLVFTIIVFTIFFKTVNFSFQLDDRRNIVENTNIKIKKLSYNSLKGAAFKGTAGLRGLRSLSYMTFAVNYYFSGLEIGSYRIVNLILHIINAFLIYLVILRLFSHSCTDKEAKDRLFASAFFTALLWLVTPLNSQAVIYIVQRMTLLMTMFFLLSFYTFIIGREEKRPVFFILSFVFFVLSVMSKENGITLLGVIVLYEIILVRSGDLKNITKKEYLVLGIFLLLLLIPLIAFKPAISRIFALGFSEWGFTFYESILTQFRVIVLYLTLLIAPLPGRLSLTHNIIKSTSLFTPVTTIVSIILVTLMLVTSLIRIKRSPYLSFAILFFFITISVETILPIEFMYEHRMYLPCIFFIGAFVNYLINKFYSINKTAVIATFCSVSVLFGVLTNIRGSVWEDKITMWRDVTKKYPSDVMSHYNLGIELLRKNRLKEAESVFAISVKNAKASLQRSYSLKDYSLLSKSYNNLGSVQLKQDKLKPAEKSLLSALELISGFPSQKSSLMSSIFMTKDEYDKALIMYNKSLAFTGIPRGSKLLFSTPTMIKTIYENLGQLYLKQGDLKKAEQNFLKSIEYSRYSSLSQFNLGIIYFKEKRFKEALQRFIETTKLEPNHAAAYVSIGRVYYELHSPDEALKNFMKAIEINETNVPAYNEIGLIYKERGDYQKAAYYFNKALGYAPNDSIVLRNLKSIQKLIKQ